MNLSLLAEAAAIASKCDRDHPADRVLREAFRLNPGPTRRYSADISRAVFAWFRWKGALPPEPASARSIEACLHLDRDFAENPGAFPKNKLQQVVPRWLRDEMDVTTPWLQDIQRNPRLWLRARKGCGPDLASRLGNARAGTDARLPEAFADTVLYEGSEDLFRTAAFQSGEFEIQDVASQAVGLVCAPKPGETWWDACAGEGGKTLHLSDLMGNKGLIWASDRAAWRLRKLRLRAARARCFNFRTAAWEGNDKLPTKTRFDGVLVDAPCSGIGTWQRNPHARWTTTPQDIRELGNLQCDILSHASTAVKAGGRLFYAVCTLTRTETQAVTEDFTRNHPGFEPLPLPGTIGAAPAPVLTIWPQTLGGNGMYIAAWKRIK
jgi:16S rRNA (cytosine967-C5)-methyltransferase